MGNIPTPYKKSLEPRLCLDMLMIHLILLMRVRTRTRPADLYTHPYIVSFVIGNFFS